MAYGRRRSEECEPGRGGVLDLDGTKRSLVQKLILFDWQFSNSKVMCEVNSVVIYANNKTWNRGIL